MRASSSRPGFVTITFTPAEKPDVDVTIGKTQRRVPAATNPAVVEDVPPGVRRMSVVWQAADRERSIERVLEVSAIPLRAATGDPELEARALIHLARLYWEARDFQRQWQTVALRVPWVWPSIGRRRRGLMGDGVTGVSSFTDA